MTVERPEVRILRFLATPTNIAAGEASTLAWQTENATEVTISGIGAVRPNGSTARVAHRDDHLHADRRATCTAR